MLRSKILWRLLAILAVGAMVVLQPISRGAVAESGRDYARCINCCNHIRQACENVCRNWCDDWYSDDTVSFGKCYSECVDVCIEESKECKLACAVLKPGYSPEEP